MAGNRQVPLKYNGKVIGTATVDENGFVMADIEDEKVKAEMFYTNKINISIWTKENTDD